jgi:hypothetical protein
MKEQLFNALLCAIIGYVYSSILTEPGKILDWWKAALNRAFFPLLYREGCCDKECIDVITSFRIGRKTFKFKRRLRNYEFLYTMLIGCSMCVSGQIALWSYVIVRPLFDWEISILIVRICSAIIICQTFDLLFTWMRRNSGR